MNVIVFGKTKESARKYLMNMVGEMKHKEVDKIYNTYNKTIVKLLNGDIYTSICANENIRGIKCDKAYIEANIGSEILNNLVLSTLCDSRIPIDERIIKFSFTNED
ncbi:MAG: hypothetical protein PHN69_07990 [Candidatus Pacebacteria bacterium]|nr:hypothetical protein [Candidatus Paceibacterota bacterium]